MPDWLKRICLHPFTGMLGLLLPQCFVLAGLFLHPIMIPWDIHGVLPSYRVEFWFFTTCMLLALMILTIDAYLLYRLYWKKSWLLVPGAVLWLALSILTFLGVQQEIEIMLRFGVRF